MSTTNMPRVRTHEALQGETSQHQMLMKEKAYTKFKLVGALP